MVSFPNVATLLWIPPSKVELRAGRAGGFVRLNLRDTEVTVSGGFTGNYLEDTPSGYVALGVYRTF